MNPILKSYFERKESELVQANQLGKEMKGFDNVGKEYYAIYAIQSDTILEWIEKKVKELYPEVNKYVSFVGLIWDLHSYHCFKQSTTDQSLIYVHKKRFKRYLKKAIQRNGGKE